MNLVKKYLSKDDLGAVAQSIGDAERNTCGQIRVVVRHRRYWGERKLPLYDLAMKEFLALGMEKTIDRTGVLILVLYADRKFQIIADEGIHRKVERGTWDRVASGMSDHFKRGDFRKGLQEAVRQVGAVLAEHFPRKDGGTNELPDDVIER